MTQSPIADVCLVIEGSYPYVTGGVASWVHQLINGLPELTFALAIILPDESFAAKGDRYLVPANVITREHIYLFDEPPRAKLKEPSPAFWKAVDEFHEIPLASRCPFTRTLDRLWAEGGLSSHLVTTARGAWRFLTRQYAARDREVSFLDYFWTWRATHGPMFRVLDAELPRARVYHALSTGYAGMLAARARWRQAGGMLLTEHGIYTRERDIEITQAEWIYREPMEGSAYAPDNPFFKRWWREQYRLLARMAYDAADSIVALHEVNQAHQVAAGAPPEKMVIVPNAVPVERYSGLREPRDWSDRPFRVGLIGRVVPIKDVKTFLRGVQLAAQDVPLEAFVVGPMDEDPDYAAECRTLVEWLGMESTVTFTGEVNVGDWLPRLDLVVLTSVSESQPLVVLEGAAAGIPAICTDVGGCRELLMGRPGEDERLGPGGLIVPVASPDAVAQAIVELVRSPERHAALTASAMARVERSYRQDQLFASYRALYRGLAGEKQVAG